MQTVGQRTDGDGQQLFISVADGVGHALLQLSRLSETAAAKNPKQQLEQWQAVRDISQASLQLLEGYSLTLRLQSGLQRPELAPISIKTLLGNTADLLEPYAKQFGVQVELDVSTRMSPIFTDGHILQAALVSLGQVFIAAHSQTEAHEPVRLAAHRSRYGIVVGLYGRGIEMSNTVLRRARSLGGTAFQPYTQFVNGPASGVFVADGLLHSLASQLHAARYHNTAGLAATLPICQQLELV